MGDKFTVYSAQWAATQLLIKGIFACNNFNPHPHQAA
jgi:hypothetical protein